jgi:hypothetical protein
VVEEETMKKLLGLAVAFAGITFAASNANAHPCISGGFCRLINGNGVVEGGTEIKTHIVTTPSGNINATCHGDVTPPPGPGAVRVTTDSPQTKGFFCFLGCDLTAMPLMTTDWFEEVASNQKGGAEANLHCFFHKK